MLDFGRCRPIVPTNMSAPTHSGLRAYSFSNVIILFACCLLVASRVPAVCRRHGESRGAHWCGGGAWRVVDLVSVSCCRPARSLQRRRDWAPQAGGAPGVDQDRPKRIRNVGFPGAGCRGGRVTRLSWRCSGRCWVYDMICGRPRYRAAAHVVRRRGHPLSPPVVAGSRALGFQGAGGIPLLAPARCPCAACAAGAPRPATPWSVGDAPCAGRCDGRSGRVPFVPGCVSARGTLPATCFTAGGGGQHSPGVSGCWGYSPPSLS